MSIIQVVTEINAPIERCFDLARSIDFHVASTQKTQEKAITGVTSGLIGLNETVTLEAVHFGVRQKLTAKVMHYERPTYFRDEMQEGIFAFMRHEHIFEFKNDQTFMTDRLDYAAPLGVLGTIADRLLVEPHLRKFLIERNAILKAAAESDLWKQYLPH
jgi:ligand-binding SRPBCC domain-containing protein